MYANNSLVILRHNKAHGDGEHALKLTAESCGMVVQGVRSSDGNHRYIIDFGPYGQWHCTHNELSGDDNEGWDNEEQQEPTLDFRSLLSPSPSDEDDDSRYPQLDEDGNEIIEPVVIDFEADMKRKELEIRKGKVKNNVF